MTTRLERLAREAARAAAEIVSDTNRLSSFRITKFGRHKDGYFHARVSINGETVYVHCQWGSWFLPREVGSRSGREVLSPFKDVLTEQMRSFEARERRAKVQRKEEILATSVDAASATRLLKLVGYGDDEIVGAVSEKFKVTHAKACGILQQTDERTKQQEEEAHAESAH